MSLSNTQKAVKHIRRKTRRRFSTEDKIRIVLDGLRGEISVAELCRRKGINPNLILPTSSGHAVKRLGLPQTLPGYLFLSCLYYHGSTLQRSVLSYGEPVISGQDQYIATSRPRHTEP